MKSATICFAGRIGSGKTTISGAVADSLNWPRVSFGDYVRMIAKNRGLDSDSRDTLRTVGEQLISTEGWDRFCKNVLDYGGWIPGSGVVVDGIRHAEALANIRRITDRVPTFLVFLDLGTSDVFTRARQAGKGIGGCGVPEHHSTESQVIEVLPSLADIVLSSDDPIDDLVGYVKAKFL